MTLIKNTNAERMARNAVVLDLGDLARQGEVLLQRARAEADQVLADARNEAKRLIDEASAKGYAEGRAKGEAEGCAVGEQAGREQALASLGAQLEGLTNVWSDALQRWEHDRSVMLLDARQQVLQFAFALAERVVCRVIEIDPSVVVDQLDESLALLVRPTSVRVVVHPDDRPLIEEALPALRTRIASCAHLSLRDDPSIERGGCRVMTAAGEVDARIETQLARLAETLVGPNASLRHPHQVTASTPAQHTGAAADESEDAAPEAST